MFLSQLLSLLYVYLSFLFEVSLRANEYFADSFAGIAFDLFDPSSDTFKALFIIDSIG